MGGARVLPRGLRRRRGAPARRSSGASGQLLLALEVRPGRRLVPELEGEPHARVVRDVVVVRHVDLRGPGSWSRRPAWRPGAHGLHRRQHHRQDDDRGSSGASRRRPRAPGQRRQASDGLQRGPRRRPPGGSRRRRPCRSLAARRLAAGGCRRRSALGPPAAAPWAARLRRRGEAPGRTRGGSRRRPCCRPPAARRPARRHAGRARTRAFGARTRDPQSLRGPGPRGPALGHLRPPPSLASKGLR